MYLPKESLRIDCATLPKDEHVKAGCFLTSRQSNHYQSHVHVRTEFAKMWL